MQLGGSEDEFAARKGRREGEVVGKRCVNQQSRSDGEESGWLARGG
jgi:hypothetical protein